MRRELLLPKLGLTMTEGTLVEWSVKPGERFRADQTLFIVESEKAATEIPAEAEGVLLEAAAEPGATLAVGSLIGYWDDLGAGASAAPAASPATTASAAASARAPTTSETSTATSSAAASAARNGSRLIATPLARRIARERGVDLAGVQGSGPRGRLRVAARPVPAAASHAGAATSAARAVTAATQAPAAAPSRTDGHPGAAQVERATLRPATSTEQTIARRLVAAKQEIPHFYLAVEAEVTALQKLRAQLNDTQPAQRFTLNHFIVAAVGRALAQMPQVNRVWTAEGILSLEGSDVGMAVDTERGLMVPVLRDVGQQPLSQVARDANAAATRAQAGRLGAAEMAGGAITVSNAGMHDVTYMTSIINLGQAMILGVGSVRGVFRPGDDDQPVARRELGMVLSADHRVLDGVTALRFLKRIVAALENPLGLLVA